MIEIINKMKENNEKGKIKKPQINMSQSIDNLLKISNVTHSE